MLTQAPTEPAHSPATSALPTLLTDKGAVLEVVQRCHPIECRVDVVQRERRELRAAGPDQALLVQLHLPHLVGGPSDVHGQRPVTLAQQGRERTQVRHISVADKDCGQGVWWAGVGKRRP